MILFCRYFEKELRRFLIVFFLVFINDSGEIVEKVDVFLSGIIT